MLDSLAGVILLAYAIVLELWFRPIRRRWPQLIYAVPIGLAALLIPLDLYALFRVIVPALG